MQFFKLTPLQSRLAASLIASVLLVIIYFTLAPHNFAYAAELDSVLRDDHNHHRIPLVYDELLEQDAISDWKDGDKVEGEQEEENEGFVGYVAEFLGMDRGIIGRAAEGVDALFNNVMSQMNLEPNTTHNYVFSNSSVWGNHTATGPGLPNALKYRSVVDKHDNEEWLDEGDGDVSESGWAQDIPTKRQNVLSQPIYISVNVCQQPSPNTTTSSDPPQLTLYISQSEQNQKPGPSANGILQVEVQLNEGFANYTLNATGDVYIGISAPPLPNTFTGGWSFQVAASIDAPYHAYNGESPFLFLVDSDSSSALLVTNNLTDANSSPEQDEKWMESMPFTMFAFAQNNTAIKGISNSYCGLNQAFGSNNMQVERGMITRGLGNKPKEQFYITGLNGSSTYYGFLAMYGNSTKAGPDVPGGAVVGGGGQVWTAMNFTTKTDGNCQVIFNLTFCSEVAYAVPANPGNRSVTNLTQTYDDYAASLYQNFDYSLQQIACNTTNTAQYSLARNCTDCAADYKTWLCAVSIPRCADLSARDPWLQPRNVLAPFINGSSPDLAALGINASETQRLYLNSSRNPIIDSQIMPGPYKEVLPCEDLCYSLVQSCPAKLGFACPRGQGLSYSYGRRSDDGVVTCSYLGAVYYLNAGKRAVSVASSTLTAVVAALGVVVAVMGVW